MSDGTPQYPQRSSPHDEGRAEVSVPDGLRSTGWGLGPRRPWGIRVACIVLGGEALLAGLLGLMGSGARELGGVYWPYLAFTAGGSLVCAVALWRRRSWGLWGLALCQGVDVAVTAAAGELHPTLVALSVVCLALATAQRRWLRERGESLS